MLAAAAGAHRARIDRSAAQDLAAAGLGGPVDRAVPAAVPVRGARRGGAEHVRGVRPAGVAQLRARHDRGARAGMGALPAQLAAGLPAGVLRLGRGCTPCAGAAGCAPPTASCAARAVVVATDPRDRRRAAARAAVPRMRALTTYYHVPPQPPTDRAAAAPRRHRRPGGQHRGADRGRPRLLPRRPGAGVVHGRSVTPIAVPEAAVRRELARLYGVPTDDWDAPAHRRGPARRCPRSRPAARCAARSRWATGCSWPATTATPRPPRARWSAAAAPPRPS